MNQQIEEKFTHRDWFPVVGGGPECENCGSHDYEKDEFCPTLVFQAIQDSKTEREELAYSLLDMYSQYCPDGHQFMSAGEMASGVLERYGYADFDIAGRMTVNPTRHLRDITNN